jgi:NTE family protein
MSASRRRSRPRKRIDLALQGGGAHGAFTWGVLDRLLEDERLEVSAISGTSAGAMNAVVLASGLMAGGRSAAREALRGFWTDVGAGVRLNPLFGGGLFAGTLGGALSTWSPLGPYLDMASRVFSPYQLNPLNVNPLRRVLEKAVDFDAVRRCDKVRLFVGATHVRSGRLKVFRNESLSLEAVLASACLPMLFQAVEIDGEAYWDGGYMGNPSLFPLVADSGAHDLLLVQLNPLEHDDVPTQAPDILERIDEITFNGSVLKELRLIAMLKEMLHREGRPLREYHEPLIRHLGALHVHRLDGASALADLGSTNRLQADTATLTRLHRAGHAAADEWLGSNFAHLGRRSTVDLAREFGH